jgi:hypothetical protein
MRSLSWVIPYYRNVPMLRLHLVNLSSFAPDVLKCVTLVLIDDGSPADERPDPLLMAAPAKVRSRFRLLRVLDDIPWNQHGARNLGAKLATTDWLLMTDIDRIVPAHDMQIMLTRKLKTDRHYKPLQYVARPDGMPLSELSPRAPLNQFLCTRKAYWRAGGYDEAYCGSYGGDAPFLKALEKQTPLERMTDVRMLRFNRHVLDGANTSTLDREAGRAEYSRRYKAKRASGNTASIKPINFQWTEVHL